MPRPARLILDAGALHHNFNAARKAAPAAAIYAVVKADAYGHGLGWASAVLEAAGADAFAVACIEEARAIRAGGTTLPILLLEGFVDADEFGEACALQLDCVIHCASQVAVLEASHTRLARRVWVKVDTGMGRLGFSLDELPDIWRRVRSRVRREDEVGLFTHLACADTATHPRTEMQIRTFDDAINLVNCAGRSMANSAGMLSESRTHGDWVRPGIMLYGVSPLAGVCASDLGLRPVARFETDIIAVKDCPRGGTVGYGGTFSTARASRIAIAAVGYGDGYPRSVAPGTNVLVNGQAVPLAGHVSMDMLAIDVTDAASAEVGDVVELWGPGLPVEQVARAAGTIGYELLCRVTNRVRRITS